jgi:hypothetical protein
LSVLPHTNTSPTPSMFISTDIVAGTITASPLRLARKVVPL